jgi:hypothetical protein
LLAHASLGLGLSPSGSHRHRYLEDGVEDAASAEANQREAEAKAAARVKEIQEIIDDANSRYKEWLAAVAGAVVLSMLCCALSFVGFSRIGKWIFNAISFRWVLWIIIYCRFKENSFGSGPAIGKSQVADAGVDPGKKDEAEASDDDEDPFKKKAEKVEQQTVARKLQAEREKAHDLDNRHNDEDKVRYDASNASMLEAAKIARRRESLNFCAPWFADFKRAIRPKEQDKAVKQTEQVLDEAFKDSAIDRKDFVLFRMKEEINAALPDGHHIRMDKLMDVKTTMYKDELE